MPGCLTVAVCRSPKQESEVGAKSDNLHSAHVTSNVPSISNVVLRCPKTPPPQTGVAMPVRQWVCLGILGLLCKMRTFPQKTKCLDYPKSEDRWSRRYVRCLKCGMSMGEMPYQRPLASEVPSVSAQSTGYYLPGAPFVGAGLLNRSG